MIEIKNITPQETFPIRHEILRKGKPIDSCKFDNDDDSNTFHLGCFVKNRLIGVVSTYKLSNLSFNSEHQFQIRGMAILEEYQRKGIGEKLIQEVEKITISNKTEIIWFNARESTLAFYLKLGYKTFGTKFEINGIGTHYLMYKSIA